MNEISIWGVGAAVGSVLLLLIDVLVAWLVIAKLSAVRRARFGNRNPRLGAAVLRLLQAKRPRR